MRPIGGAIVSARMPAPKRTRLQPRAASSSWKAAVKALILPFLLCGLVGCSVPSVLRGEDPQAIVDKRVIGMSIGDFFQRYGVVPVREEARDGSMQFIWEGGRARVPAGPRGPEESICRLRLSVDKAGRIVGAPIIRDGQGERRLSRCVELFA